MDPRQKKYCRQCSCEVRLGWLSAGQISLMSNSALIDGRNAAKVTKLCQDMIQMFVLFLPHFGSQMFPNQF